MSTARFSVAISTLARTQILKQDGRNVMKALTGFVSGLICLVLCAQAEARIAYFNGPSFSISLNFLVAESVDLNRDGVADLEFLSGPSLTTGEPGNSTTPVYVSARGSNSILCAHYNAIVLLPGATIGDVTISNTSWGNVEGATLATFFRSGASVIWTSAGVVTNAPSSGWSGPLADAKDGFLAVRLAEGDGPHYGWIHVSLQSLPTALDWAYETQPGVPITAGAVPTVALETQGIVRPGFLRLTWRPSLNTASQVQCTGDLNGSPWTNLGFTTIATGATTVVDVPLGGSAGFFRVVQTE